MNDRLWRRAMVKSGKGQTMTMGSGRVFSWAGVDEEKSFIQNYIKDMENILTVVLGIVGSMTQFAASFAVSFASKIAWVTFPSMTGVSSPSFIPSFFSRPPRYQ